MTTMTNWWTQHELSLHDGRSRFAIMTSRVNITTSDPSWYLTSLSNRSKCQYTSLLSSLQAMPFRTSRTKIWLPVCRSACSLCWQEGCCWWESQFQMRMKITSTRSSSALSGLSKCTLRPLKSMEARWSTRRSATTRRNMHLNLPSCSGEILQWFEDLPIYPLMNAVCFVCKLYLNS